MLKNHFFKCGFLLSVLCMSLLTACQAPSTTHTSQKAKVAQNEMKVKTRTSSFIYFAPIAKKDRTVYISVQNDSGSNVFDIKPWLAESFQKKSFVVVNNVDMANVVVRANLFRVGKVNNENAHLLLDSEFGNSTQMLYTEPQPGATEPLPNNDALVLDIQYFERNNLINPAEVKPRSSMAGLSDIQLLLLCNTSRWERFQTRIVSVVFGSPAPMAEKLKALGFSAENANSDIVRGLS